MAQASTFLWYRNVDVNVGNVMQLAWKQLTKTRSKAFKEWCSLVSNRKPSIVTTAE